MRRRGRKRPVSGGTLALGLSFILCAASVVRLLYAVGIGTALDAAVRRIAENEVVTGAVLEAELGRSYTMQQLAGEAVISQSALLYAGADNQVNNVAEEADAPSEETHAKADEPTGSLALSQSMGESILPDMPYAASGVVSSESEDIPKENAETEPEPEPEAVPEPGISEAEQVFSSIDTRLFTEDDADGITLRNDTSYSPDILELLNEPLNLGISQDEPTVLIIHTHGTEAYSEEEGGEESGTRSTDTEYNIVRVGTEIAGVLKEKGINVIHDTGIYDYPSYNGSYTRTLEVIEQYLAEYPTITAVLDVHRDAGIDEEGNATKTTIEISGKTCSQVMLVVGTNEGGLPHPNFIENVKLSLKIQAILNSEYPGLARPLNLRQERFNQHATNGSLIAEIGFAGNTLSEAIEAGKLFAAAYAEAILS